MPWQVSGGVSKSHKCDSESGEMLVIAPAEA